MKKFFKSSLVTAAALLALSAGMANAASESATLELRGTVAVIPIPNTNVNNDRLVSLMEYRFSPFNYSHF